jgi:creatinine amidohydrolase/Fe(II)-dependent formamide hydrolase-like protein
MTRFVVLVAHGGTEERLRAFAASTISEVLTMSVFVRSRLTRLNRFTPLQQANALR